MNHPLPERLALYVQDALDVAESAALEQHVTSCAPCAASLQGEAGLEEKLHELTQKGAPMARASRRYPTWAVAAAAAVLLTLGASSVARRREHHSNGNVAFEHIPDSSLLRLASTAPPSVVQPSFRDF